MVSGERLACEAAEREAEEEGLHPAHPNALLCDRERGEKGRGEEGEIAAGSVRSEQKHLKWPCREDWT